MEIGSREKILYILVDKKIKPVKFIDKYRQNDGDINKTLDYFLRYENLKLIYGTGKKNNDHTGIDGDQYRKVADFVLKNKVNLLDISDDSYPDILKQIY